MKCRDKQSAKIWGDQFAIMLGFCLIATVSNATTVHTWKDANGITHFSDEAPGGNVETDEIVFEEFSGTPRRSSADGGPSDYYSIAKQWQRLKAERDAANALSLERKKLRDKERDRLAALAIQQQNTEQYAPSYPIYSRPYGAHGYADGYSGGYQGNRHHLRRHNPYNYRHNQHPSKYARGRHGNYRRPSAVGNARAGISPRRSRAVTNLPSARFSVRF